MTAFRFIFADKPGIARALRRLPALCLCALWAAIAGALGRGHGGLRVLGEQARASVSPLLPRGVLVRRGTDLGIQPEDVSLPVQERQRGGDGIGVHGA